MNGPEFRVWREEGYYHYSSSNSMPSVKIPCKDFKIFINLIGNSFRNYSEFIDVHIEENVGPRCRAGVEEKILEHNNRLGELRDEFSG